MVSGGDRGVGGQWSTKAFVTSRHQNGHFAVHLCYCLHTYIHIIVIASHLISTHIIHEFLLFKQIIITKLINRFNCVHGVMKFSFRCNRQKAAAPFSLKLGSGGNIYLYINNLKFILFTHLRLSNRILLKGLFMAVIFVQSHLDHLSRTVGGLIGDSSDSASYFQRGHTYVQTSHQLSSAKWITAGIWVSDSCCTILAVQHREFVNTARTFSKVRCHVGSHPPK